MGQQICLLLLDYCFHIRSWAIVMPRYPLLLYFLFFQCFPYYLYLSNTLTNMSRICHIFGYAGSIPWYWIHLKPLEKVDLEIFFYHWRSFSSISAIRGICTSNPMAPREIWDKFPESIYKMNTFHFVNWRGIFIPNFPRRHGIPG